MGTERYVAERPTAGYRTISDLMFDLSNDLRAHGIRPEVVFEDEIVLLLDPDLDGKRVSTGTNDRGLVQHVSVGDL